MSIFCRVPVSASGIRSPTYTIPPKSFSSLENFQKKKKKRIREAYAMFVCRENAGKNEEKIKKKISNIVLSVDSASN